MNQRLRVGVVGCGGIAQMMHLPTLAERPDLFEIVGLADVRRDVVDAVGARYGVDRRVTDARELLADREVDAVLLLASGSQARAARTAIEAGKHVFVEKPLGFGVAEVEDVLSAAREHPEKTVMVGYHKRYDPVFQKALAEIRTLEDLRYVDVTVLHPDDGAYRSHHAVLPLPASPPRPIAERDDIEGLHREMMDGPHAAALGAISGPSVDLRTMAFICTVSLVHDINLVRGTLGEPEAVLSANVWRGGFAQSSVVAYPKDVRVNMTWVAVPGLKSYEETLRFVSPEKRVTLTFPSPYLRHLPTGLRIDRTDGDGLVVEHHTPTYEEAFRVELHAFRDCVLSGAAPATGVEDALGDARFIEALVRAARRS